MIANHETHAGQREFRAEANPFATDAAVLRIAAEGARAEVATEIAECLVNGLVDACGAIASSVFLVDDDRPELRIAARRNAPVDAPSRIPLGAEPPFAGALEASVARSGVVKHTTTADGAHVLVRPLYAYADARVLGVVSVEMARGASAEITALGPLCEIFGSHLARAALRTAVTDHERFERSLRETARRFRACFDQTFHLAWMLTADGTVVDVNAAALEFANAAARDVLGRPFWEAAGWGVAPDAHATLRQKVGRAAGGESVRCEMALSGGAGRSWTVDLSLKPVLDEFGRMAFLLAEARDVTDRKRGEDARQALASQVDRERQWLRTVIEHAPVGILLFGGESKREVVLNPRAAELLRYTSPDAQGAADVLRELLDGGARLLEDVLGGELVLAREFRLRGDGPSDVTLLVSGAPIGGGDGPVIGAVVLLEDISAIKTLERLREEWTSVIAHDLRQPLNAIQLHSSRLARLNLGGASVEHIVASTRHLDRMISELWDMAAIDARQLSMKRSVLDVSATTRAILDRMGWSIGTHSLMLHASGATDVVVDPDRFEQVLWNLVLNADKYGTAGTLILVEVERRERDAVVSVTNEGDGIDETSQKRIFDRFHRLSTTRTRSTDGLGLGLYISKQLTEAQGGKIWVESAAGERTSFRFTVPLAFAT